MMRNLMLLLASATTEDDARLTFGGAVIMATCIVLVLGLLGFCLGRILWEKHPERHHAPLEIDTHDQDTEKDS